MDIRMQANQTETTLSCAFPTTNDLIFPFGDRGLVIPDTKPPEQ